MPEKNKYPQIPSTVWWGVRAILNRTPNATLDERMLGIELGVQEVAAKAYINELRQVGIIDENSKATDLAKRWRLDDSYEEAVDELVRATYPEGLLNVAPPGDAERQKVVSWFEREGLGRGAAGNKAATYLLLSSASPNEAPKTGAKPSPNDSAARNRPVKKASAPNIRRQDESARSKGGEGSSKNNLANKSGEAFPLNVNVQIHISADAGTEQIESIFQAMRRYLYDTPTS